MEPLPYINGLLNETCGACCFTIMMLGLPGLKDIERSYARRPTGGRQVSGRK